MKVCEHIAKNQGKGPLFSLELIPPPVGRTIDGIFHTLDQLMEFQPPFVDVTYHREELFTTTKTDGHTEQRVVRRRPGTVGICAALKHRYNVDAVPHLICGGFSQEDTESALVDLGFLGVQTVLALRGDKSKTEPTFAAHPQGHHYAYQLVNQIQDLNRGKYLHEATEVCSPTDFEVGVAGYPETHEEADTFEADFQRLKEKVAAGADFIVTQMFFDNSKYFQFVDRCRAEGIDIPIIPGLKPITTVKQRTILPQVFHLDLPEALDKELAKCETNAEAKEVGIAWCVAQCRELAAKGAPVLHFYTMSRAEATRRVAEQVF